MGRLRLKVEQIADDGFAPGDAPFDAVQGGLDARLLAAEPLRNHEERDADGPQGVAQLVADRGRHLAQGGQPLLADHRLLPVLNALDHVVEGPGQRAHLIVGRDLGADVEVAASHLLGGPGQRAQRGE